MLNKAFSFPYSMGKDDDQKIMLSIEAVMGVVRDNYMVMEYQKPAVYPSKMSHEIKQYDIIVDFLREQYDSLRRTIESSEELKRLCSDAELEEIEKSLKTNQLLLKL